MTTHFTTTQACTFILVILRAILNEQTDARLLKKDTANYIYDSVFEQAKKLGLVPLVLILLVVPSTTFAFASVDNNVTDGIKILNPESVKMLEDQAVLNMNITYWNGTQALLNNTVLNFALSDEIIQFINEKIVEENEGRIEEAEPAEEQIEEQKEESGSGDSDNDDGGGNDTFNPGPIETIEPVLNPPIDETPPESGDGGKDSGDEGGDNEAQ